MTVFYGFSFLSFMIFIIISGIFCVQRKKMSFLFHIKKAILQFRFNVIMARSKTERKRKNHKDLIIQQNDDVENEKKQSVKRQFTLFLRGDEFVGILTACDCIFLRGKETLTNATRGTER